MTGNISLTLSGMEPQFHGFRTRRLFNILSMLLVLTYLLLLEKLTGFQPVKKFPAFHGGPRFITAFTSTHQLSLSGASSVQSIPPHPTSWRSILTSSSHLRLVFLSGLFTSDFPARKLYTLLLSPIRATCLAHLISILSPENIGWGVQIS